MIKFNNVSFSYNDGVNILNDINLEIKEAEILVICGSTGVGKSTLLKLIKEETSPNGKFRGEILRKTEDIAIVFQNTDSQIVSSSVISDLVFGMENVGLDNVVMRKRLAETVSFFGIEHLLHKNPEELSGGEKQLVVLCSAMMMQPKVLVLDEPLSQLDPIRTQEFLDIIKKINEQFSVSIVICEHTLDEVIKIADRLAIMSCGEILHIGTAKSVMLDMYKNENLAYFMPEIAKTSIKLYQKVVFTPKELKSLGEYIGKVFTQDYQEKEDVITCKNILFSYDDNLILNRLSFSAKSGNITAIFGGNGSGKSTFLKLLAGIHKNYIGKIKMAYPVAYIPQNVSTYFLEDTVFAEIYFENCDENYYKYLIKELDIEKILQKHPFDISGGESAKVCIASVLLKKPKIILMDEPTKGMDNFSKKIFAKLIKQSTATIIMASHDLSFCARYADICAMLFDGDISYMHPSCEFFNSHRYYTTAINKAFDNVLTFEDIVDEKK